LHINYKADVMVTYLTCNREVSSSMLTCCYTSYYVRVLCVNFVLYLFVCVASHLHLTVYVFYVLSLCCTCLCVLRLVKKVFRH